jgi:murein tripeptide amidase MpaA
MSKLLKFGWGSLLVLFLFVSGATEEQHMQVRVYISSRAELLAIKKLNLDVTYTKPGQYLDIVSNSEEVSRLQLLGFKTEVIHSNLERFYEERLDQTMKMGGYHTYDETVAALDSIHNEHPTITSAKINIGTTVQGRTIWAMKISDNPGTDEDEAEVYYSGLIHAREPITIEILLYFMRYLTNNYGTDPVVTDIVDNRELWFVPIINPDGYERNRLTNPDGGGMWRKNRRNNGGGVYGVDLNRNFGYMWGYDNIGSSPYPSSETYRGTAPFSEPETQAVRDFINSHDFVTALNYHSYSNLYVYPWGYVLKYPEDYWIYKEVGDSMSAYNGYISAPGWVTLYTTNGDADDWDYGDWSGKKKIISYTPEVGDDNDGFWPPSYRILPLCQENLGPNIYIAKKAGELYSRPYRFFENSYNFIDTFLVSDDSLVLNLRITGHQPSGDLNWTVSDPDSFEITGLFNLSKTITGGNFTKYRQDWNNYNSISSAYPQVNWLRVEPQNGTVSPGGYFDHRVVLDASALPSQCVGKTVQGAIVFYVSNGTYSDSIIVPVTFLSGPARQVAAINTSKVRSDITNLTNIHGQDDYGWRYTDEGHNYLYDGSLFLAYLKTPADTFVYRDFVQTHSFGASSDINIDTSDPNRKKGYYTAADLDCNLQVRGEVLAPSHPDSSELMIYRYSISNLSPDTIKSLYLGMVIDWDVPTSYYANYAGYDSSLNLIWQQGPANQRYAGIAYLSKQSLYGAQAIRNDLHIWPTGDLQTGEFYQFISTPGYFIEGSPSDLSSILTAKMIDLNPGDSVKLDFALVSTRTSLDSLKASVSKARAMVGMYLPGDANGDRVVNVTDVIYLINYLFKGGSAPVPFLAGDANCDGAVTITDVIYLINYLFKGGPGPCS